MSAEEQEQADLELMKQAAAKLSEHFCSVQIFCSKSDGEDTKIYHTGQGNWYARYGQVRAWIDEQIEGNRQGVTRRVVSDDE